MKRCKLTILYPIISLLFVAVFCCFIGTGTAYATSASINVSGNEGAIPLNASASFSAYEHCDNLGNCSINNSGSLAIYQDNSYIGGSSGNGGANWSTTLDGGVMSQGTHTFVAIAYDSNGVQSPSTTSITIDNTPQVTINSPGQVEGAFDITGTATFKPSTTGTEGSIYIYIDNSYCGSKTYEGTNITWVYSDITGRLLDAGSYSQGAHTITVTAYARNGKSTTTTSTFTIDNTPQVTINSPGQVEGAFDITGTATFKPSTTGTEGSIYIYIDNSYCGSKTYEGTNITWVYSDITGRLLDAGSYSQGAHTITVTAYARNGKSTTTTSTFTIDNTPTITIAGADCSAGDILGNAIFKVHVGGVEGTIAIYINGSYKGAKSYEGTNINWKYSEITGSMLSLATWEPGQFTLKAVATAINGASATAEKMVNLPDCGCPEASSSSCPSCDKE